MSDGAFLTPSIAPSRRAGMKLDDEMIRAFHATVHRTTVDERAGWYEEREAIFAAGYRMGLERGRAERDALKAALREMVDAWDEPDEEDDDPERFIAALNAARTLLAKDAPTPDPQQ